ncbi:hypothetical protein C1M55_28130 [Rhodococcus qingshengii]|uniref:hypothetical protein n=1 Tax=Rhodococcus qingshengii TaxID=334542 RepID=UPI000C9F1C31|nr:hypothetical protein [Rhodococcus qingshengii]AUS34600.1 hypothetical protein C1M55_28130 [Rhodococcus qingshengii]
MSAPLPTTPMSLEALRAQGVESLGGEPGIEIQITEGGEIFTVPNPLLVDDTVQEALPDAKTAIQIATAILGEETHARFIAAGGHSNDVMLAWRMLTEHMNSPKLPR